MKIYKPKDLSLEAIFSANLPVKGKFKTSINGDDDYGEKTVYTGDYIRYIPACYVLVSAIIEGRQNDASEYGNYVNLSVTTLNTLLGSGNTREICVSLLLGLDIIQRNDSYKVHRNAKSYRLNKGYSNEYVEHDVDFVLGANYKKNVGHGFFNIGNLRKNKVRVNRISDTKTNDLVRVNQNQEVGFPYPLLHGASFDYQKQNLGSLRFDFDAAYRFLESENYRPEDKSYIKMKLDKLKAGDTYATQCPSVPARINTSFNQLNKEFRPFVRDRYGNELYEFDFKASHVNHLVKAIFDDLNSGIVPDGGGLRRELESILDLLKQGQFYKDIQSHYFKDFKKQITKEIAKRIVLTQWFNGAWKEWKSTAWIRKKYRHVTEYIDNQNRDHQNTLAVRLMRSEATLLNTIIVERLATEHPNSVAYTVFDAIVVEEDYYSELAKIIHDESERYFGFEPQIESKPMETPLPEIDRYKLSIMDIVPETTEIMVESQRQVKKYNTNIETVKTKRHVLSSESHGKLKIKRPETRDEIFIRQMKAMKFIVN